MRLREMAERRVSGNAPGESLRTLSPREIEQVAGAIYYDAEATPPEPTGLPGKEPPFPPELNPLPQ